MDKVIDFVRDTATATFSAVLKCGAAVCKKATALIKCGAKSLVKKCGCKKGEKKCPCTALLEKLRPVMKITMIAAGAVALVSGLCFFLSKKK